MVGDAIGGIGSAAGQAGEQEGGEQGMEAFHGMRAMKDHGFRRGKTEKVCRVAWKTPLQAGSPYSVYDEESEDKFPAWIATGGRFIQGESLSETPGLPCVLTINAGSSSLRFAVYEMGKTPLKKIAGKIDRIGLNGTNFSVKEPGGNSAASRRFAAGDHQPAADFLLGWLESQLGVFASIKAVGHRVVHGMRHTKPEKVTPKLLAGLRRIMPYDPDHLPAEIALIEALRARYPRLPQVACFDTAFHRTMPPVAKRLPIPRRYAAKGVERYGFHGLSYTYLLEELGRLDPAAARGRVILAHLGNGASLAAVHRGRSIDTSMGFTPAAGLVMGTRPGDLDPGLVYYLARTERMTAARFQRMVNHESGLRGVSGTSSDLRVRFVRGRRRPPGGDVRSLLLSGAKMDSPPPWRLRDTPVFSAGIGENAPDIRARICAELGFLGLKLDRKRNAKNASLISTDSGRVKGPGHPHRRER